MHTNLKTIIKFRPCSKGITKLMNNLGHKCTVRNWEDVYNSLSKEQQTKDIDFKFILKSNSIKDMYWGLCTQPKKIRMLISADVLESVLHIYEKKHPNDMRVRNCIQGIRDFCNGKITQAELNILKYDARADVGATAAADAAVDVVADAAAADVAIATAFYGITGHTAHKEQWKMNKEILLKYI